MPQATIYLKKIIQDSQDYGSDDEHMVSRVFFDLETNESRHNDLFTDVKQPIGGSFETSSLEVTRPANYQGPFNYEAFRSIIEDYYRSQIGGSGSGIRIQGGSNIRMRNNTFVSPRQASFEVSTAGTGW